MRAKWRAKNPEKRRAAARARYLANPEKFAATVRAWQAANPDKVRAAGRVRSARRRSLKKAATVPLTAAEQAQISAIYAEADRRTAETGVVHEVDHDKPLARGGVHHPSNLIVVPRRMNRSKGARYESVLDFILN
jgi:hypothetical protein